LQIAKDQMARPPTTSRIRALLRCSRSLDELKAQHPSHSKYNQPHSPSPSHHSVSSIGLRRSSSTRAPCRSPSSRQRRRRSSIFRIIRRGRNNRGIRWEKYHRAGTRSPRRDRHTARDIAQGLCPWHTRRESKRIPPLRAFDREFVL